MTFVNVTLEEGKRRDFWGLLFLINLFPITPHHSIPFHSIPFHSIPKPAGPNPLPSITPGLRPSVALAGTRPSEVWGGRGSAKELGEGGELYDENEK